MLKREISRMSLMFISISLLIGYIMGAIPFGLGVSMIAGKGDIREIGSGNIGATNVLRTGRKDLALLTFLLDAAKAAAAVGMVYWAVQGPYHLWAGAGAVLGHCFPVWLGFKGGKGVSCFFGVMFATAWKIGLIAAATWLLVAVITRYSSLAALIAVIAAPIAAHLLGYTEIAIMAAGIALIIIIRHRENIARLTKGMESKIGQKANEPA